MDDFSETEGLALMEKWIGDLDINASYDQRHPLLIPLVLQKVVSHMIADAESDPLRIESFDKLRACRLVNRVWNEEVVRSIPDKYKVQESSDVGLLLNLVNHPDNVCPFIRKLYLDCEEVFKIPETFSLLWSIKDNLKVLEIVRNELDYYLFMMLPKFCPGIQELVLNSLDEFPVIDMKSMDAECFQEFWGNPMPFLKTLRIINGIISPTGVKFIITILKRLKSLENIEIETDEQYTFTKGSILEQLGNAFSKNPQVLRKLKSFVFGNENCTGFLSGFNVIELPRSLNLHTLSIVQKAGGTCGSIPINLINETISKIVQASGNTLKNLTIVNSSDSNNLRTKSTVGSVILPQVLPSLEFLCFGNVGLDSVAETSSGFYKLFPKLKHFEFWVRIFSDIPDGDKYRVFKTLFPNASRHRRTLTVEADSLQNFHLYTRLEAQHNVILKEIRCSFPNLKSLMLEVDGPMLQPVVQTLKDLDIEHFTLVYYETMDYNDGFNSAVTGIPIEICIGLRVEETQTMNLDSSQIGKYKTCPSFVDWKSLTRLNISYRHGAIFDSIFLTFCLQLITKLKHIELRHFDIDERLLIRMVKKMDLATLKLGNCKIIPHRAEYPIINDHFGVGQLPSIYNKNVKLSFANYEGPFPNEVPYYATLLNNFDYQAQ